MPSPSESETEEHSHPPFISVELQVGIVAGNGIVVYRCGSGKLVAPGIYHGSTAGDDD